MYSGQFREEEVVQTLPSEISPMEPVFLALYNTKTLEVLPIDIVDVVKFTGHDPQIGRTTSGLKSVKSFKQEVLSKIKDHLDAITDPNILISKKGVKYDISSLNRHKISIDSEDYLTFNNLRIVYFRKNKTLPLVIDASKIRGDTRAVFKENKKNNTIFIVDPTGPQFFLVPSETAEVRPERLPEPQRKSAKNYSKEYQVLRRESGKV